MRYLMVAASVAIVMILTFEMGKMVGYANGKTDALATNPVSEELELVCAGLWIGEENRKYWKKHESKR